MKRISTYLCTDRPSCLRQNSLDQSSTCAALRSRPKLEKGKDTAMRDWMGVQVPAE